METFSLESLFISLPMVAPLLVLLAAALAILIADVAVARPGRWLLPGLGIAGCLVALGWAQFARVSGSQLDSYALFGMLVFNPFVYLAQSVILGGAVFLLMISPRYIEDRQIPRGEYYALIVFATMAMMALAASAELLTLFLNIELLSITLYVLAGCEKRNRESTEAAFKYFLLGSLAAAFLLLGIAFVFGATGETRYAALGRAISADQLLNPSFLFIGFSLIVVGFCFKLTLAPFHMYAPDVYDGAPTPAAAAIATGTKVAGFAAFASIMKLPALAGAAHGPMLERLWIALYAIAVASMVIGNVGAIVQPRFKRLLAYSSIAHSGYMLVPLVVMLRRPELADSALMAVGYYMIAYMTMTLLAFGLAATLGRDGEGSIAAYAGLGRRAPVISAVMALAMFSLIGVPPTVGWFGKWRLFLVAVEGGHVWLAVIGFLASVASAFYYLRVVVTLYMEEPARAGGELTAVERPSALQTSNVIALAACAVGLFAFVYLFV